MDGTAKVKRQAQAAGGGDAARTAVLAGWAAKGVVYLVLAWLVLQLARRSASEEASTTGALELVAGSPGGRILLVVLGLGLLAYAVGRILEVTTLATSEIEASDRAQAVVMAAVYGALAVSAFAIAGLVDGGGGGGGGGDQGSQGSAFLLDLPGGRFLVGAVGLGAMALGAYVAWTGVQQQFLPTLRTGEMSTAERTWTTRVGVAAYITKGAIFALVGWFFLQSAIAYDPDEATGIDGALRRVADASWGRAVLVAVAVGLLAYGIFCLVEARYRRIGSAAGGTA